MLKRAIRDIYSRADKRRAETYKKFFKTGRGEYGEGDFFIGVKVPVLRAIAKSYRTMPVESALQLVQSSIHEFRMVGLFILIFHYTAGDGKIKNKVFNLYLKNAGYINNWDLVDLSAPNIVGDYLLDKPRKILYRLAKSRSIWLRRISILATLTFIRNNDFKDAFKLSEFLVTDKHDLMHKAVGWMLREIGKRNRSVEEKFLKRYYKNMPRTMLRYAIEKFPEPLRKKYLSSSI